MRSVIGQNVRLALFGGSHAAQVGAVIDGIRPGVFCDPAFIARELGRRSAQSYPGLSTQRHEQDIPSVTGIGDDGYTTGARITVSFANSDIKSGDYSSIATVPRPGHADYTAYLRYGFIPEGGGHYSGRMTAPLVFAGAICQLALRERGICIGAHLLRVGGVEDIPFDMSGVCADTLEKLKDADFPTLSPDAASGMKQVIGDCAKRGDSVGGMIECAAVGLGVGIGTHAYRGIEGVLSALLFGIPALKGVEFGAGVRFADMYGSEANDAYRYENGSVRMLSNNCGGILGGMSCGTPVVFRAVMKPTPSVALPQESVDLATHENVTLKINGRHDPCCALRAVPCVEAAAAIGLLDLYYD